MESASKVSIINSPEQEKIDGIKKAIENIEAEGERRLAFQQEIIENTIKKREKLRVLVEEFQKSGKSNDIEFTLPSLLRSLNAVDSSIKTEMHILEIIKDGIDMKKETAQSGFYLGFI